MWELKICVTYTGIKKLNEAPGDTPTHHQMSMQIEINWWNTWNPPQRMQVIEEPYWWIQIYWHRCCYTKATAPLRHFPRNDTLCNCTFFTIPPQNQPSAVSFPPDTRPQKLLSQPLLTTSPRKTLGLSDFSTEDWWKIFPSKWSGRK